MLGVLRHPKIERWHKKIGQRECVSLCGIVMEYCVVFVTIFCGLLGNWYVTRQINGLSHSCQNRTI